MPCVHVPVHVCIVKDWGPVTGVGGWVDGWAMEGQMSPVPVTLTRYEELSHMKPNPTV